MSNVVSIAPQSAEDGVRALIKAIGEDADREGLIDTPKRVVKR
jgi:GTP cyclohydrolase I